MLIKIKTLQNEVVWVEAIRFVHLQDEGIVKIETIVGSKYEMTLSDLESVTLYPGEGANGEIAIK